MTAEHSPSRLSHWDAHRLADWLAGGDRVAIIPVGALEQHGPHLPLGTDAILSETIAAEVATTIGGVATPPFAFGYKSQQKSGGGDHLVGSTSLDAATLVAIVQDVVRSLLRQGFTRLVFLNGHYENYQFLYEGVDLALREAGIGPADPRCVLLLSYWDYVSQQTLDTIYGDSFPGWDVEHGGVLETSLMLHLHPELVAMDRAQHHPPAELPRFDRLPIVPERTPASGCLSAPDGACAEYGQLLFDQVVRDIADDLVGEFSGKPALR